jgi:hypothetical protein
MATAVSAPDHSSIDTGQRAFFMSGKLATRVLGDLT